MSTARRLGPLVLLALVMAGSVSSTVRIARALSYRREHRAAHVGAFTDLTHLAGVRARHEARKETGRLVLTTGQAWSDYDRDGAVDLFVTGHHGPSVLYRNTGGGTFAEVTGAVPSPAGEVSAGAVFADYDNDGWPDLYVAGIGTQHLYRNDGGRRFAEVPLPEIATDVTVMGATWADYDGDGFLDAFVATYGCVDCGRLTTDAAPSSSRLYRNERGQGFTDVTELLPLAARTGFTFIGTWGDYDDDGRPDLYLAKDVFARPNLPKNALIRNAGPGCGGWCFTDASASSGADIRANAMGLAVGDYDNDGRIDLYFSNSGKSFRFTGSPRLLRNAGGGRFSTADAGVDADAWSWGTEFLDYDGDGWQDLYLGVEHSTTSGDDRLFRNRGDGTFSDETARAGTATGLATFGLATADYNGDGRPDLVVGDYGARYRLFANAGTYDGQSRRLSVRLQGAGPVNRDAVGARVTITTADGRRQLRDVRIGSSLGSGSDTALLFGAGTSPTVGLDVLWPDGRRQSFADVPTGSKVELAYGGEPGVAPLATPVVQQRVPRSVLPPLPVRHLVLGAIGVLASLLFAWRLWAALRD